MLIYENVKWRGVQWKCLFGILIVWEQEKWPRTPKTPRLGEWGEPYFTFPKGSKGPAPGLAVPSLGCVVPGALPRAHVWKMPLRWPSCSQSFHPALPVSVLSHQGQCVHESSPQWLLLRLLSHLQFRLIQGCAGQDCERLFLPWPRQLQRRNRQMDRNEFLAMALSVLLILGLQPCRGDAIWSADGTCGRLRSVHRHIYGAVLGSPPYSFKRSCRGEGIMGRQLRILPFLHELVFIFSSMI